MCSGTIFLLFLFVASAFSDANSSDEKYRRLKELDTEIKTEQSQRQTSIREEEDKLKMIASELNLEKKTIGDLRNKLSGIKHQDTACSVVRVNNAAQSAMGTVPYDDSGVRRWDFIRTEFQKESNDFRNKCSDMALRAVVYDMQSAIDNIDLLMAKARNLQANILLEKSQLNEYMKSGESRKRDLR